MNSRKLIWQQLLAVPGPVFVLLGGLKRVLPQPTQLLADPRSTTGLDYGAVLAVRRFYLNFGATWRKRATRPST